MKKHSPLTRFIARTALFVAVVAVILAAGEWAVRTCVPNPYRIKDARMTRCPLPRTVVVGNSHSYYGVVPALLPQPAVSLANVSQTLAYDLALLRRYDRAGRLDSMRMLVAQVSYTSLFDAPFEDSPEWWRCVNYKLYMGLDLHPALSRYGFELLKPSVYAAKLRSVFGFGEPALLCDSTGFGLGYTCEARGAGWADGGADIAAYHTSTSDTLRLPANIAVLADIVALADRHGARTVFFTQPEWISYRNAVDPSRLALMRRAMADFVASHPGTVWLDLFDDPRFTADDFYDADHLNTHGAARLTRILREESEEGEE